MLARACRRRLGTIRNVRPRLRKDENACTLTVTTSSGCIARSSSHCSLLLQHDIGSIRSWNNRRIRKGWSRNTDEAPTILRHVSGVCTFSTKSNKSKKNDKLIELGDKNEVVIGGGGREEERHQQPRQSLMNPPIFRFEDLQELDSRLKRAVTTTEGGRGQGLSTMTEIQSKTWRSILEGRDVLGRARTGTGKTLAFLLPSIQRLLVNLQHQEQQHQHREDQQKTTTATTGRQQVQMVVISPTRELAIQIGKQAESLTRALNVAADDNERIPTETTGATLIMSSLVMYGGRPKSRDLVGGFVPEILIATPGRLLDHLDSSTVPLAAADSDGGTGGAAETTTKNIPFYECFRETKIVVLDEMDRLLEMGFLQDIQTILSFLPDKERRQTLLFSATLPKGDVYSAVDWCIKSDDHDAVDCIQDHDPTTHVNANTTKQSYVVLPRHRQVWGVVHIILRLMDSVPDHKILVFFPTTSQVSYFSELFRVAVGRSVMEMHSQLSQNIRTCTSERFCYARRAVMLTSDVSARGVDYPDVTHVIQVGMAENRETYIHRLGRTGRAGKRGEGLLVLLDPAEATFLRNELAGLDIPKNPEMQSLVEGALPEHLEEDMMRATHELMRSGGGTRDGVDGNGLAYKAQLTYRALFGYYAGRLGSSRSSSNDNDNTQQSSSREVLVNIVNTFATQAGLSELPAISDSLANAAGVKGHPGLNLGKRWDYGKPFDVGRRKG